MKAYQLVWLSRYGLPKPQLESLKNKLSEMGGVIDGPPLELYPVYPGKKEGLEAYVLDLFGRDMADLNLIVGGTMPAHIGLKLKDIAEDHQWVLVLPVSEPSVTQGGYMHSDWDFYFPHK